MNDQVTGADKHEADATQAQPGPERVKTFGLDIASGMLESLGLNMYTSIGKSLSEFVANAYDADANQVLIEIPFERIDAERAELRARAKNAVAKGERDKFTVLVDPLPDDVMITIEDDGHGMLPVEIRDKLLVVSRNRRKESGLSESGQRHVMGRKGLGKLAGFGTAERVTIWSKRAEQTFATEFTMNYAEIADTSRVGDSKFEAKYEEGIDPTKKGTFITLAGLRCDSLKATEETIREILAQNFALYGDDFNIVLNGIKVVETPAEYEFIYPPENERDGGGFGTHNVTVSDVFDFPIRYQVRFRARQTDNEEPKLGADGKPLARGNLPAGMRGARIYCNGRLAAGPTLLNLQTGMHNFHSQSYMECIVHADEVDRQVVDHIGTNRADLKGDSDVVEALRDAVTELMRVALYEHSKFRDEKAEKQLEEDPISKALLTSVDTLSKDVRKSARKLLTTLAAAEGVNSEIYKEAAPLLVQSMNAGDVLAKLIELEHDPKSIPVLAHELLELSRIENRDVLKIYRGRRRGIEGLRLLIQRARESWKKGARFENDLQILLKDNPWLIKPEFSRYLTSDKPLGDVAKQLTIVLKIDESAPAQVVDGDGEIVDQDNRPDLVFAMVDSQSATTVTVVELKTPNYPLRNEHLNQLEGYMMRVEDWLKAKFTGKPITVRGFLIGDVDEQSQVESVKLLNKKRLEAGPLTAWEIIPLPDLLERSKRIHLDVIEAAESNDEYLNNELSTEPAKPKAETVA